MSLSSSVGRTYLGNASALSLLVQGPLQTESNFSVTGDQSIAGSLNVMSEFILSSPTVPASAAAAGVTGTIAWDASYIYVCVATNTWKRAAIATWP